MFSFKKQQWKKLENIINNSNNINVEDYKEARVIVWEMRHYLNILDDEFSLYVANCSINKMKEYLLYYSIILDKCFNINPRLHNI